MKSSRAAGYCINAHDDFIFRRLVLDHMSQLVPVVFPEHQLIQGIERRMIDHLRMAGCIRPDGMEAYVVNDGYDFIDVAIAMQKKRGRIPVDACASDIERYRNRFQQWYEQSDELALDAESAPRLEQ
jgi:hypothetical protein